MPAELALKVETLEGFLLVMARMGGMLTFLPMPGLKNGPGAARIVFAVCASFLLAPVWKNAHTDVASTPRFLVSMGAEILLGIATGLLVSFLAEALVLSAQVVSLQAGYSYASTIDPNTDAEAGYLTIVAELFGGMLCFALGLDRQVLAILGASFERVPPGGFTPTPALSAALVEAASNIFVTGLRLALPATVLLVMTDLALALIGRLNSQLQVTTLAFPVKMLAALALTAATAALTPAVLTQAWQPLVRVLNLLFQ